MQTTSRLATRIEERPLGMKRAYLSEALEVLNRGQA